MTNFQKLRIYSSLFFVASFLIIIMFFVISFFVLWNTDSDFKKSISKQSLLDLLEVYFNIQAFESIYSLVVIMFIIFFLIFCMSFILLFFSSRIFSIQPKFHVFLDNQKDKWFIMKRTEKKGLLLVNDNNNYRIITDWNNKTLYRDTDLLSGWEKKVYSNRTFWWTVSTLIFLLIALFIATFIYIEYIVMKLISIVFFPFLVISLCYLFYNIKRRIR